MHHPTDRIVHTMVFVIPMQALPQNSFYQQEFIFSGARCSSVVRAFAHGAMGRRIDPSLSYF